MLFSVLIANYNNAQYISTCINSILQQTYQHWEVIIVDDASTDNSVEIIKQLIKDDCRFILHQEKENKGCGYAKRKCAALANGDICGFVDPDDAIYNHALSDMVAQHQRYPNAAIIYSNYIAMDSTLSRAVAPIDAQIQIENGRIDFVNQNGHIGHFSTFKKLFYEQTTGIDAFLRRAVDQDLYLKLYEVGDAILLDKVLYQYRIHKGGISTLDNTEKAKYWYWAVLFETAKRRKIHFEEKFCQDFIWSGKCWIKKEEIGNNPLKVLYILGKKLLRKIFP